MRYLVIAIRLCQPLVCNALALSCLVSLLDVAFIRAGEIETLSGRTMGASFTLKIANRESSVSLDEISEAVTGELARIESIFSLFRAESEISRVNSASERKWIAVSEEFYTVLKFAVELSKLTDGAFDPTARPLLELWQGSRLSSSWAPPSPAAIAAALKVVGVRHLRLQNEPPAVQKLKSQVQLDLNALVEGWAIRQVLRLLKAKGCTDALFELGGEFGGIGYRGDGTRWKVGIEDPRDLSIIYATVSLQNAALCTSGSYRQFREYEGKRYSHILDPRTGHPIEHSLLAVSVLQTDALTADGWATALLVLGPVEGANYAARHGIAVSFVSDSPGDVSPTCSEFAINKIELTATKTQRRASASRLNWIALSVLFVGVTVLTSMFLRRRSGM